jgi:hypothetical protein
VESISIHWLREKFFIKRKRVGFFNGVTRCQACDFPPGFDREWPYLMF